MRNTVTKGNLGRERLLAASSCIVHHEGKSGQEAKAGTEAEIREALPKVGGPSTSIIKKMPPKDLHRGHSDGGILSAVVPSSILTPDCVKLTKS